MRIARPKLIALAAASATPALLRFPAGAAEFTYKYGHQVPPVHPAGVRMQQLADKVLADSGGRLEIKVFPNSQLGSDPSMLGQLRSGALEFYAAGDNILANIVPVAGITAVPFAFGKYADAWNTVDGALGKFVRAALLRNKMYAFDREWDYGFRQIINGVRPINGPGDLKGLKFRVPSAPMQVSFYKTLGVTPADIAAAEMYTALQTHLVDGLDQPLATTDAFKLYEVQKYVAVTNQMWTGVTMIANPDALQKLPKNLQDLVEKNFDDFARLERNDMSSSDVQFTTALKSKGMIFSQPDVNAFKGVLRTGGFYAQWRETFGAEAWAMLEKSVGKLA
jgi:tripartite ATP-independent transporter DctP family solute receptor